VGKFHTRLLPVTLPFVLYGKSFLYLYCFTAGRVWQSSDLLLNDRALLVTPCSGLSRCS